MHELFYKNIEATPFELKDGTGADAGFYILKGYASTFNNVDRVGDIMAAGAFTKSIAAGGRIPKLLAQHDTDDVIGVVDTVREDDKGLYFEARLPKDNSLVKDIVPLVKLGAIDSCSIGFNTIISEWNEDTGIRTLKEVDLWEISIVTFPANEKAKISSVKKFFEKAANETVVEADEKMIDAGKAEAITTKREFELALESTGMFTKKARVILASKFNEIQVEPEVKSGQRDSVNETALREAVESLKKSLT